ncbi:MAG TPA: Hsp33 family molecular chaperone HslO [Oscillospiraceae bacterium]|nr:Hsp33 family molecular chaperone HslO [Oscillospiraceae bacterium]
MRDEIVRAVAKNAPVKAAAVTGAGLVQRAYEIHHTTPVATAALGRCLLAASMMGNAMKEENASLTLRVEGGGPLGAVTVVSDSAGNVRGYVRNPAADVPSVRPGKLDVGSAVGADGYLTVVRDLGLREPYVGRVRLVSGEIAEDVTAYFAESEQTPSACALGVLIERDRSVGAAGGYLISLMPGADDETVEKLEAGIRAAGEVSPHLAAGLDAEGLLRLVLRDFELEVSPAEPVSYRCYCDRARVERALISLGKGELQALIDEQGGAEMTCQFCDAVYRFDRAQLEHLLADAARP